MHHIMDDDDDDGDVAVFNIIYITVHHFYHLIPSIDLSLCNSSLLFALLHLSIYLLIHLSFYIYL